MTSSDVPGGPPAPLPRDAAAAALGADRRAAPRRTVDAPARIAIAVPALAGTVQSLSASGLLLVAREDLAVDVTWTEDGVTTTRKGRLVRVQRLSAAETGFAIEFLPHAP